MKCGTNIEPSGPHSMHTVQFHGCNNASAAKQEVHVPWNIFWKIGTKLGH
jgi:hypothetical protein